MVAAAQRHSCGWITSSNSAAPCSASWISRNGPGRQVRGLVGSVCAGLVLFKVRSLIGDRHFEAVTIDLVKGDGLDVRVGTANTDLAHDLAY